MADEVLRFSIEGITNIIFNKGVVNLDFNDLKTTLANKGVGHLGIGRVNKEGNLLDAVNAAVNSPLLDTNITGATNLLINSSGDVDLMQLNEAISYVRELAGPEVNVIWGTVSDEMESEEIVITLIATGMKEKVIPKPVQQVVVQPPKLHLPAAERYPIEKRGQITKPITPLVQEAIPFVIEIPPFLQDATRKRNGMK